MVIAVPPLSTDSSICSISALSNQEISDLGETLQPPIQTAIKDVNGLLKQPLAESERGH